MVKHGKASGHLRQNIRESTLAHGDRPRAPAGAPVNQRAWCRWHHRTGRLGKRGASPSRPKVPDPNAARAPGLEAAWVLTLLPLRLRAGALDSCVVVDRRVPFGTTGAVKKSFACDASLNFMAGVLRPLFSALGCLYPGFFETVFGVRERIVDGDEGVRERLVDGDETSSGSSRPTRFAPWPSSCCCLALPPALPSGVPADCDSGRQKKERIASQAPSAWKLGRPLFCFERGCHCSSYSRCRIKAINSSNSISPLPSTSASEMDFASRSGEIPSSRSSTAAKISSLEQAPERSLSIASKVALSMAYDSFRERMTVGAVGVDGDAGTWNGIGPGVSDMTGAVGFIGFSKGVTASCSGDGSSPTSLLGEAASAATGTVAAGCCG